MKLGIKDIIGKQITGVIAARHRVEPPRQQLFLIFSDGTSLELYGESFNCAGGLDRCGGPDSIQRGLRAGTEITDSYFIGLDSALVH